MGKQSKTSRFYKAEMIAIYNIITNNNIIDKKAEIVKIGNLEKLDLSLRSGIYSDIDTELNVIQQWLNEYNSSLLKNRVTQKLSDLVYLNMLYTHNLLNENTYYPIFKKIQKSRQNQAPKFSYLLENKNFSSKNSEIISALNNMKEIEEAIKGFHSGLSLQNLKYRKVIEDTLENNNYLENYNYAEYLLKTYINCNSCYRVKEFITYANISKNQYDDCVKTIEFLNPVLFKEYKEKKAADNRKNVIACNHTFAKLARDIIKYRKNGSDMPPFEFLSQAPFLGFNPYQKNIRIDYAEKISVFMNYEKILKIILSYLYRNNLNTISLVNPGDYLNKVYSINGYVLSEQDKKNIYQIMKLLGIGSTDITIRKITDGYFNNQYNLESLQKCSKNHVENILMQNPYEYKVRVKK